MNEPLTWYTRTWYKHQRSPGYWDLHKDYLSRHIIWSTLIKENLPNPMLFWKGGAVLIEPNLESKSWRKLSEKHKTFPARCDAGISILPGWLVGSSLAPGKPSEQCSFLYGFHKLCLSHELLEPGYGVDFERYQINAVWQYSYSSMNSLIQSPTVRRLLLWLISPNMGLWFCIWY